jgi:aldehyde dehydrogenase (NAD+)
MSDSTFQNFIGGEWVDGPERVANVNPSDTRDVIGHYAQASPAQVEQAIGAAQAAQREWAKSSLEQRYQVLMAIGNELIERSPELGELLAREEGKTRPEGAGEVYRSGQFFHYYAAEVLRQMGETADSVRPGVEVETRREPVGTVAIITPWNFPVATGAWKIAPALAFGNSVIWKPANLTPASGWALTEIISRQALPAGLFNLVMGSGGGAGNQLVNSPGVNAITFTGSVGTGRRIAQAAAANLTKVQLEMGSKNALAVLDDADLETAVNCAMNGAFSSTGQKCTASSRLVVTAGIHDAFVAALIERMKAFKVGPALAEDSQMGPAVDERQLQQNLRYVALAEEEGATRAWGGERLQMETPGFYMQPCLFTGTRNDMQVNRDEIFGPITCVIKVADYEQALTAVNDTEFGLTAGIITQSLKHATHFKRHAEAGCVMINLPTAGTDYHVPFGGRKASSFGSREQGQYAREFYTQVKTIYINA